MPGCTLSISSSGAAFPTSAPNTHRHPLRIAAIKSSFAPEFKILTVQSLFLFWFRFGFLFVCFRGLVFGFVFGCTHDMQRFPGQGSKPHHSGNQSYSSEWQHWTLSLLSHQGTPIYPFSMCPSSLQHFSGLFRIGMSCFCFDSAGRVPGADKKKKEISRCHKAAIGLKGLVTHYPIHHPPKKPHKVALNCLVRLNKCQKWNNYAKDLLVL